MTNDRYMKVKSITFDLHLAITSIEKQSSVFLRVAVLHKFYSISLRDFKEH